MGRLIYQHAYFINWSYFKHTSTSGIHTGDMFQPCFGIERDGACSAATALTVLNNKSITRLAITIAQDITHPLNQYIIPLPSGRRYRTIKFRRTRLGKSLIPAAIAALNSRPRWSVCPLLCCHISCLCVRYSVNENWNWNVISVLYKRHLLHVCPFWERDPSSGALSEVCSIFFPVTKVFFQYGKFLSFLYKIKAQFESGD